MTGCLPHEVSLICSLTRFVYAPHQHLDSEWSTMIDQRCMSECAQIGKCSVVRRLGSATFLGDWSGRNESGESRVNE